MAHSFLPYARQSISREDRTAAANALKGDVITRGAKVEEFEQAMAQYCEAKYAVAFNTGTAALMGAYFAAGLSKFDQVVSTPNSFVATIGAAFKEGAKIVFGDIDRQTGNLDLNRLETRLHFQSTRGKLCVVPVHFAGIAMNMKKLDQMIRQPDAIVIEDAAHALGSFYPSGEKVGSCAWSHMTIFSFHPAKIMTTGEGGLVTTNDAELYHRLVLFRNNGIEREEPYLEGIPASWYYEVQAISGNYNFTDMQAALGLSQLQRLNEFIEKRRSLVRLYRTLLAGTESIKLFSEQFDEKTAFHLFVVQVDFKALHLTREEVMQKLKKKGIGTQVHYIPLYRHPFFKHHYGEIEESFPEMESYYSQALSLPLYYDLKEEEIEKICQEFKAILAI
jgi:UDP-4-amino-4,6-dideoxy-L-N-acetyl-beta-L-altrosamine transaminase